MAIMTAARFARRELRGALGSFRVLLLCLTLGVAGLAGVGSVVAAINAALAERGQDLLGGDVSIELTYRFASDAERAAFEAVGDVSEIVDFRAMARTLEGEAALVQAKAVDSAYPLYGAATLEPQIPFEDALSNGGALVEQALLTRLGLEVGDRLRLGEETFEIRAALLAEPDQAAAGLQFGPRFMFSSAGLPATGLVTPGTLYETDYRIRLPKGADLDAVQERLQAAFPEAGWRWRDRRNGAPGVARFIERLGAFLTLVGLAALAVGGVGVGASVRGYLDGKTDSIATLKTLGADGATILWTYLLQIAALTILGVAMGVALGAAIPVALAPVLSEALPVPASFGFYPAPLLEAALYGVLAALLFALWPLARAREVRAAGLFRDLVSPARAWPRPVFLAAMGALAAALAGAAAFFTGRPYLALAFIASVAAALALLALAAWGVGALARAAARSGFARGRLPLRAALSGLGGASGETRGAVLALGLGLTVLTAIGLIDFNLRRMVSETLPERAPTYFFVDIQNADLPRFLAQAEAQEGVSSVQTAPMLRGVISRINGVSAEDWIAQGRVAEEMSWVLRGDRGVTYSQAAPEGAEILEGAWWPEDYAGPPLVSFGAEQGRGIGLSLGDEITVNVLGREITAKVANFREVNFREMGINFLMTFTPNTLRGAPHVHIATIYGQEPRPGAYLRTLAAQFPAVSGVRVEEAAKKIAQVLTEVAAAARAGAAATLITGLVVLVGAAAASQRRQIYDAAILKTLGASRGALLGAMGLRAALLGAAAGLVALMAGALAAAAVCIFVFEAPFAFDITTAVAIVLGGVCATILANALFAAGPLSARPAQVLRTKG